MKGIIENLDAAQGKVEKMFTENSIAFKKIIAENVKFCRNYWFAGTQMTSVTTQLAYIGAVVGLHEQTLRRVESGHENISIDTLTRIGCLYKVPLTFMLMQDGARHFILNNEDSSRASIKKLASKAVADMKECVIYFDGDTPTMLTSSGKIRTFYKDDVIVWKRHMGEEFCVAFLYDEEKGAKCILHHYVMHPSFKIKTIRSISDFIPDWILATKNCSTVLTVTWDRTLAPQFQVVKSNLYRQLSNYIKSPN